MKNILLTFIFLTSTLLTFSIPKDISVTSPDGILIANITNINGTVSLNVSKNGTSLFKVNEICILSDKGSIPEGKSRISSVKKNSVDNIITPEIKERSAQIKDKYNEITLTFSDKTKFIVRAYDEGIAYRLVSNIEGEILIMDESAKFDFDSSSKLIIQPDDKWRNCGETPYKETTITDAKEGVCCNVPALVQVPSGESIVFMESGFEDYPTMWLKKKGENLQYFFWGYPKKFANDGNKYNDKNVTEIENFIAKTSGKREFPWRIFAISHNDGDLIANQLVYQLAPECSFDDPSWIKPGWVTLDWWSRRGLHNVDFKAGINTETAKYMIDFASKFGVKYFLFDDGWTKDDHDLTSVIPQLNMPEVTDYAAKKGVDVMLWVTYDMFVDQMDKALEQFSKWGIKGLKIDFMDRNDQLISHFYDIAAKKAAEYKMVLDFHGSRTPDGLRRKYPNVLTREGLIEFEFSTWSEVDNPRHHCLLPFIRCVAGPADYIPGTMNNAHIKDHYRSGRFPQGVGTRAHSIALAVIIESTMHMIPDAQTTYYREQECTEFLTSIPLEWDETIPLECKIGKYVSVARRNGDNWYVAAITDLDNRDMKINLDFLPKDKKYKIDYIKDGINSDVVACDYIKSSEEIKGGDVLDISLAPGGGWIAKITPL